MKDIELGKRIAWLRTNRGMEQKAAAEAIGILYTTYQKYEYGNFPSRRNLDKILKYYACFKSWLLTGEGEPFVGAREKHPEICGPKTPNEIKHDQITESVHYHMKEAQLQYNPNSAQQSQGHHVPEFSIADDLIIAAKVLESKTHYAMSLHLNIQSFYNGVNNLTTLNNVVTRLEELEGKFTQLQSENNSLRDEVKKLRDHSGGCVPINLTPDNAAPTGTEDQET